MREIVENTSATSGTAIWLPAEVPCDPLPVLAVSPAVLVDWAAVSCVVLAASSAVLVDAAAVSPVVMVARDSKFEAMVFTLRAVVVLAARAVVVVVAGFPCPSRLC